MPIEGISVFMTMIMTPAITAAIEPTDKSSPALAQIEGDIPHPGGLEVAHRQHPQRVDVGLVLGGIEIGQFATDHHLRGRFPEAATSQGWAMQQLRLEMADVCNRAIS